MSLTIADLGFTSIQDQVVLLSGASTGIGRATAKLLARAGAHVAALARTEEKLAALGREITDAGFPAPLLVTGDVRREPDCTDAVARCLERFGRLDVLVNNAAIGFPVEISACSTEDYKRTMETNIDGVFYLTRAALGPMRRQKSGHIVMISSDAGSYGSGVAPIYSTSKHALEGFTGSLREQLERMHAEQVHIRLSNIWPATVDSEYWGQRQVPRHTFMSSEEMAQFIVQVIACQPLANVAELRVKQFRFSAAGDAAAAEWFEKNKR